MARIVMKFGGTSVADLDRIRNVANRVKREVDAGHQVAVVVSAMSGVTNQLVKWCQDLSPLHDAREYDTVVALGEQVTTGLTHRVADDRRRCAVRRWQPIITDQAHGKARSRLRRPAHRAHPPWVIAGFQGIENTRHRITTLGRGGSDLPAVVAVNRSLRYLYDVDGIHTTDPSPRARSWSL